MDTATTSSSGTYTVSISNSSGTLSSSNNPCMHGNYSYCSLCNGNLSGSCTCNTPLAGNCPVHSFTTVPFTPYAPIYIPPYQTIIWPPAPTPKQLHDKEGHVITHREVVDEKGLKIEFVCNHCNAVIYKKYICRIPRKVREEKCLVRVLNPK